MLAKAVFFLSSILCVCNSQFRINDNIDIGVFTKDLISKSQILHGGLSSPGVYKFKNDGKEYVLRLSHPNRKISEKNKTIECYKLAAKNGIAPHIKYANVDKGIIISDYINGHYVSKQDLLNNKLLTKLAKTIKKLHSIDGFPKSKDIFSIRQSFEKKILSLNSDLISNAANHLKLIDNIVRDKTMLTSTHNDLKPENILFDGEFRIIDWEAACLGYPSFDLATIIVFYDLSDNEQDEFLEEYYGRKLNHKEKERIEMFKKEVLGYYGMAYLMLSVYKKLTPLSFEEINKLPELSSYLENKFNKNSILNSYIEAQKLGWILIKKLNKDIYVE